MQFITFDLDNGGIVKLRAEHVMALEARDAEALKTDIIMQDGTTFTVPMKHADVHLRLMPAAIRFDPSISSGWFKETPSSPDQE